MRGHRRQADEASVDMTPMLDIVFILLIFFIVTAVFVQEKSVDMKPPPASDQPPPPNAAPVILVQINAANQVFVNGTLTDVKRVGSAVERHRADNGKSSVLIVPDNESEHGVVVAVYDAARGTGASALIQRKKRGG